MVLVKINYASVFPIIKITYDETPVYVKTSVNNVYSKVVYGTSVQWGDIIGTLSNQTDLQNALDAKVPYTGATANVDLGEYEMKAGQVEFDQTPTGTPGVAVMRWNDNAGTVDLGLKGGNVTMQVGEDMIVRVVNKTGQNLLASNYQVVKISSAQGQRLAVNFAQANNDNNSADTIGVVAENINNNQEGFVYTMGQITEINTTGSLQGQTWVDGDVLYLSPTVAGGITNVKPVAPQHIVVVGYVEYAHQNHGKIYVKVMNGWELGELHDVNTIGATNGQVLTYNGSIWVPSTNGVGTVTSVDMSVPTGLTISGNPITSSGTLALGLASGYSIPTDANQTNWTAAYNDKINSAAVTGTTTKTLTLNQQDGGTITASWTDYDTAPVTSVFGRTGAVVATSGDYTTDQVTEGTNLYFTDARARAAISLTTTGTSGAATYVGGVLNIPQYQAVLTNPVTGTGTSGQIAYWNGTNTQTGSATLTYSPTSSLLVNNSVTAATAIARGTNLTPTLVAAANNDVLVGLDINPTFTNGAFTGVTNIAIRANGNITIPYDNTAFIIGNNNDAGIVKKLGAGGFYAFGSSSDFIIAQSSTSNIFPSNTFTNKFVINATTSTITTAGGITVGGITVGDNYGFEIFNEIGLIKKSGGGAFVAYPANRDFFIAQSTANSVNASNTFNRRLQIFQSTGNVLLQNGGTFTDGGQRLQVNGSALFTGSVTGIGNSSTYTVTASSGSAVSKRITSTLVAAANNDVLVGLDVNPTFTVGAFTGLSNFGIRINQVLAASEPLRIQMVASPTGDAIVVKNSSNTTIYRVGSDGSMVSARWYDANNLTTLLSFPSNNFNVQLNGTSFLRLFNSTGNLVLQNGGTFTDGGQRLQVTGTSYFSDSVGIGITPNTNYGIRLARTITSNVDTVGISSEGQVQSDVTSSVNMFNSVANTQNATFTLNGFRHFRAVQGTLGASSTITNQFGFLAESNLTGATNNYGFYGNIASGTNRWNLYMNGTANNYMAGSLGIGSTTLSNITLRLEKNLTGGTVAFNIGAFGTVQSDVTNQVRYIGTSLNTQAAAFTLGAAYHYFAEQGTIGAGSSITNQYGYFVNSTLIGATNNFGFYGNIPAQANAWNLYMNGTANNYMAGSLGIGSTNLATQNLRLNKQITGATAYYNFRNDSQIQTDVTAFAVYNYTISSTAASTTINFVTLYEANQGTFGAGSTITNQVGFHAQSTLIGATNNFGFRSSIPSGTNRWNLYMDGTASNYLEGDTAIGTTTIGTATKFTLGGSETAVSAIARGQLINTTLTASANNDILVGLDINPTFTNGAFTGVTPWGIRINQGGLLISQASQLILVNQSGNGTTSESIQFNNGRAVFGYDATSGGAIISTTSSRPISFLLGSSTFGKFFPTTGNFALQNGGTFTDAGYRLDVNGTIRGTSSITGAQFYASNTNGLSLIDNAVGGFLSYGYNSGRTNAAGHHFYNGITTEFMRITSGGNVLIGTTTDGGYKLDLNGTARVQGTLGNIFTNSSGNEINFSRNSGNYIVCTGASGFFGIYTGGSNLALVFNSAGAATFSSSVTAASFIPSASTVPTNGMYLPTTNTVAWATNTTERMRLSASGNLGLGITPSAWSGYQAVQVLGGSLIGTTGDLQLWQNSYFDGTSKYYANGSAARYSMTVAQHRWYYATTGTANDTIIWTQAMTLAATGNLLIGTTTDAGQRLQVNGTTKLFDKVNFNPIATPSTASAGDVYYDSTTNKLRCYNGTIWNDLF